MPTSNIWGWNVSPDPDYPRKGGKIVIIPLAPRIARAIDLYVGERWRPSRSTPAMNRLGICPGRTHLPDTACTFSDTACAAL